MSTKTNFPIDDELLAAYLDGRLDEDQTEYVENAIENSPELQWTVDRWLEEQTRECVPTEVESLGTAGPVKRNKPYRRVWTIAASILVIVTVSLPLLIEMSDINPESGLPMDFPVSERYESEYSPIEPTPSPDFDEPANTVNDKFSIYYEFYKSAAIIMWDPPVDTVNFRVYSQNNQLLYFGRSYHSNTILIPYQSISSSNKPIHTELTFYNRGEISKDTIVITE